MRLRSSFVYGGNEVDLKLNRGDSILGTYQVYQGHGTCRVGKGCDGSSLSHPIGMRQGWLKWHLNPRLPFLDLLDRHSGERVVRGTVCYLDHLCKMNLLCH